MSLDANLKVVYADVEDTYGEAETLATAILCRITDFATRQGTLKERNNVQPHYGAQKSLYMGTYGKINLEVDLVPSGTEGAPPPYASLLRMCGLNMVEVADTSVTFNLAAPPFDGGTIGYHMDGELHILRGARGSARLALNADDHLMVMMEIWGLEVEPTTTALPTPDFSSWLEPLPITAANATFSLHGFSGVLNQLELSSGYNMIHRDKPGVQEIALRDRNPGGSIQMDLPAIGSKNFHDVIKKHQTGALNIVLGDTAGSIVTVNCPKVQLINPTFPEADGLMQLAAGLKLLPDSAAGNDELTIAFT